MGVGGRAHDQLAEVRLAAGVALGQELEGRMVDGGGGRGRVVEDVVLPLARRQEVRVRGDVEHLLGPRDRRLGAPALALALARDCCRPEDGDARGGRRGRVGETA